MAGTKKRKHKEEAHMKEVKEIKKARGVSTRNSRCKTEQRIPDEKPCKPPEIERPNTNNKKTVKQKMNNSVIEKELKVKKARTVLKKSKIKKEIYDSEDENSLPPTNSKNLSVITINDSADLQTSTSGTKCRGKEKTSNCSKALCSSGDDKVSSSDSEWEEVVDGQELDEYKPVIPKEGIEITIDCPEINVKRRKRKEFDEMEYLRLHINRMRKDTQLCVHKTHILCLVAHGFYLNNILKSSILKGLALSVIPEDLFSSIIGKKSDKFGMSCIEKTVEWFRATFSYESVKGLFVNINEHMVKSFENQTALNASEYNLMFIAVARTLGFKTRLCVSLYPISHKAQNLLKKTGSNKNEKSDSSVNMPKKEMKPKSNRNKKSCNSADILREEKELSECETGKTLSNKSSKSTKQSSKSSKESDKKLKMVNEETLKGKKKLQPKRSVKKNYKVSSDESGDDDKDEDFHIDNTQASEDEDDLVKMSKSHAKNVSLRAPLPNRKVLSSDSEHSSPDNLDLKPYEIVCWAEVFSKPDKQWIPVECVNDIINKPYDIEAIAPHPVSYILAYDDESYVKDVTRRYCNEYMTYTRKLRVDVDWWEETLEPFLPPDSKLDKEEEKKLDMALLNKPLPQSVGGFKNHPLYALKRHLLKFEAIYPPDAAPVGFIRGEPVYARECVCQLHSRETWLKEARVVRIGEEPYKIVKARPKWDKIAGVMRTDLPLEIFGFWQTEPYEPPIAVDGKVPRNEYGNVELFKPCMLPRGTVHLQIPGLNRIARKLGIDCCAAVVGFDGHKGSIHPVFDGFVICEEFKDTILAAWDEEQENARKRANEKREKRIYGNWKKLIRGLLIRERIKVKYDVS